jgi:hypothetical protein
MAEKELFDGKEQNREIAVISNEDRLLEKILDSGNIEVLERFIALREKEEIRQAELAFDLHFSEMQAEFVAVKREKEGYGYKYAPIEVLQHSYSPIISKHGFSYRWKEESIPTGKRCTMIISGWGHSKENYFDVPFIEGTKQMNVIQVAGAMSTYGRRYTFIAGFGVIIEDEDDDAKLSFNDGIMYSEQAIELRKCNTLPELAKAFKAQYEVLGSDNIGKKIISVVKDECKKNLEKANNGTKK